MQNRLSRLLNARAENILMSERVDYSILENEAGFPLMIKPRISGLMLAEWIKDNKDHLEERLAKYGAILFRGFEVDTVENFRSCMDAFGTPLLEYRQRSSPRYEVASNVYHSTTYPADQSINMHCENSYAPKWPMKIAFCCLTPADEGGETPIADTRRVCRLLSDATREKFRDKGVKYVRNISRQLGLPWEEVFQTKERAEAEKECAQYGMDYEWQGDDRLVLWWKNNAIHIHPSTGEQVWFNHAFFFNRYALGDSLSAFESGKDLPFNTYYGDGGDIGPEEILEIHAAYEASSVIFPWEKGDMLLLDNMLMAHGRRPYKGERKIIVSML